MTTLQRLRRELAEWAPEYEQASAGFMAIEHEDDLFEWDVVIPGATGTPYEFGHFLLNYKFPKDYPFKPPKVFFVTPIYHSCVASDGNVSLAILRDQWSPALSALKVAQVLHDMVGDSIIQGSDGRENGFPVRSEIFHLYINDREKHASTARLWVQEHASRAPQHVLSEWKKRFEPPIVLTLHLSKTSDDHGKFSLVGTNIGGAQNGSLSLDMEDSVEQVHDCLCQQLELQQRRLHMLLPDGTLLKCARKPNGKLVDPGLALRPLYSFFEDGN